MLSSAPLLLVLVVAPASPPPDEWVSFPDDAPGLVTASPSLGKAGRTFARAPVVATVLAAAAALQQQNGANVVVIGDVGKKGGGAMPPHATHRDGRTVDILMPVVDDKGAPTQFPHGDDEGFGYCARFDVDGRFVGTGWEGKRPVPHPSGKGLLCKESNEAKPLTVDFAAVARLVRAIETAAGANGLRIKRVVVAPEYVDKVLATDDGKQIDARVASTFVRRAVWTRHDDHVHVELEKVRR